MENQNITICEDREITKMIGEDDQDYKEKGAIILKNVCTHVHTEICMHESRTASRQWILLRTSPSQN